MTIASFEFKDIKNLKSCLLHLKIIGLHLAIGATDSSLCSIARRVEQANIRVFLNYKVDCRALCLILLKFTKT